MKLLLDSHALLWRLSDDQRRLTLEKLQAEIEQVVVRDGFKRLPIAPAHLSALATLPLHHRDPFDHLLIAQAVVEYAVFVSVDRNVQL